MNTFKIVGFIVSIGIAGIWSAMGVKPDITLQQSILMAAAFMSAFICIAGLRP